MRKILLNITDAVVGPSGFGFTVILQNISLSLSILVALCAITYYIIRFINIRKDHIIKRKISETELKVLKEQLKQLRSKE